MQGGTYIIGAFHPELLEGGVGGDLAGGEGREGRGEGGSHVGSGVVVVRVRTVVVGSSGGDGDKTWNFPQRRPCLPFPALYTSPPIPHHHHPSIHQPATNRPPSRPAESITGATASVTREPPPSPRSRPYSFQRKRPAENGLATLGTPDCLLCCAYWKTLYPRFSARVFQPSRCWHISEPQCPRGRAKRDTAPALVVLCGLHICSLRLPLGQQYRGGYLTGCGRHGHPPPAVGGS